MHLGFYIRIFYGEVRRRHNPGKDFFNKFVVKRATVHVHLSAFKIKGLEEGKAHQMIPVGMGENKMDLAAFFIGQLIAKSSNAGSGIHDNNISTLGTNFKAGGIPAIFEILFSGNRYRTP
jgi:hypothetical protein